MFLRTPDDGERDYLFLFLEQLFLWVVGFPLVAAVFLLAEKFDAPDIVAIVGAGASALICVNFWGPYATRLARHLRPSPHGEAD